MVFWGSSMSMIFFSVILVGFIMSWNIDENLIAVRAVSFVLNEFPFEMFVYKQSINVWFLGAGLYGLRCVMSKKI